MKEWLFRGEDRERNSSRRKDFDPIAEGRRYGLAPDVSIALYERVRNDATRHDGLWDEALVRERFAQMASRIAERGGQLGPAPFKWTQTEAAASQDWASAVLADPGRGSSAQRLARAAGPAYFGVGRAPGRTTLVASEAVSSSDASTPAASLGFLRRYIRGGQAARSKLEHALASHDHFAARMAAIALQQDLRWARHYLARGLAHDDSLRPERAERAERAELAELAELERAGKQLLAKVPDGSGSAVDHASRAPAWVRPLRHADRATQIREAVRLHRAGELGAALQHGAPGLADAVAAALHDGAILAPHPVDVWRDNVRGLGAALTIAGHNLGRGAARRLARSSLAPVGKRALAAADAWTGGAAREWTARARGWADGVARRAMAYAERAAERDVEHELAKLSTAGGAALPAALRARMESLFGHRFAHVRIHTDAAAAQAAQAAGARALTIGSHIYFNHGQFAPGSEAGDRLLLHELTHVVQHDQGRLPQPSGAGVELSSPSDPAEREARAMEARVGEARAIAAAAPVARRGEPPAAPPSAARVVAEGPGPAAAPRASGPADDAPRAGKRASANILGDAADWAGDRLEDIKDWGEDKIASLVAKVAPGLAKLIKEGPGGLIKDAIQPAISSWIGTVTGGVDVAKVAGQLKGSFTAAFAVLQGAKAGDPKCCDTLVSGINAIREIAHAFMNNPVMDALKGVFTRVSEVVGTVTKLVIGPAFEVLKTFVGGAWSAIQGVASTIQGWLQTVKNIASKVFDWVAKKLGFSGGTGEGGLLEWLKAKAAAIWEQIKQTLQPVLGPLKVVGGVLLMFTGLPQIYAIVKYGPELVEAVQWLWTNRNNPEAVKQNPGGVGKSILPKILQVGQGFTGKVKQGASWLVEKTTAFASGALELLGAITGVPLLGMARGFVQKLVDGIKGVQTWAQGTLTSAATSLEGLYHRVADFIKPYAEVLSSVALAVVNPTMIPMILAGWAWRWLPDCIKPPLIDLLLDAVIAVLEGMPMLPLLGPLWPLLKSGILGFLHALRARDPNTKIKVSNKLAKIISGASPMFLLGFAKGLLKGVWDGIKMPFEAIWLIAKGIRSAGDFFVALGGDADKKAAKHAPAAAASGTPSTAATADKPALPGTPAVIRPEEASSVVGGIVSQLNAHRPPQPTATSAGAPAVPADKASQHRALGQEARRMAGELAGPGQRVATGFWPAVQELFSSGKGTSLDDLIAKLGKVWSAAKGAIASLGGKVANMICDFLMQDSAEADVGETIGYLVGMIAFQALLDYLSAGTWTGAMGVLSSIAKFLNWPMELLGEAMAALKKLGGYILDGLKSLGGMIAEAGAGALREVTGAFREIGTKLGEFADEILTKFRGEAGAADNVAAHAVEGDAVKAAEKDVVGAAEKDAAGAKTEGKGKQREGSTAAEKEAQKLEELAEAITISKAILRAEDAGHIPGPAIAISLGALRSRYSWIKGYEAEPRGSVYDVFLLASTHKLGTTSEKGLPEGGTEPPWEKPKGWRLPKDGTWSGTVGDSVFRPNNPESLGLKVGDTIQYRRGVPDFSPWKEGSDLTVSGMTGVHKDDMSKIWQALADQRPDLNLANQTQAKQWLSERGLTPHHAGGDTVQLIPTKLHGGIRHTGGAFELRNN
ncbi:MAG TPA: DUF4157 domain-containing protein [Kofleriaceae bacterium]|nr:DUF4157 domain-containing protein [Kofleriaceae bacterium]